MTGSLLLWEASSATGPTRVVPSSPQSEHARAIGADDSLSRLVVELVGIIDPGRLRRLAERLLSEQGVLRRDAGEEAVGPVAVLLRSVAHDNHTLTIEAPVERLDAVGLMRMLEALAAASVGPAGTDSTARGEVPAVGTYFRDLLDDQGAGGARFWRGVEPERCATPQLAAALGRGGARRDAALADLDPAIAARAEIWAEEVGATVEAVLLGVWRLLLGRFAPKEDGFLGVYRPGPAAELPETVGLLGRYVPAALQDAAAAEIGPTDAAGRFLRDADCWTDFFVWSDPAKGGFCAGYRHVDLAPVFVEAARGRVLALEAPIERLDVELRSTAEPNCPPRIEVWTGPALDPRLARVLADEVGELLRAPPGDSVPSGGRVAGGRIVGPRVAPDSSCGDALSLVAAAARETPAAPAVAVEGTFGSYADLMRHAAAVAAQLEAAEVGPGDRVALCSQREPALLASILGIWWRGAAVVPIDPDHPPGRQEAVLADVGPQLLLCSAGVEGGVAERGVRAAVAAGAEGRAVSQPKPLSGADLAYVMYTSGSSGRPKGVEVSHAALANYLRWAADCYLTPGGGGSIAHSSIAADLTITSILVPLVGGRAVWMLPSNDPAELARLLSELKDLDFLKLTPGGLALLRESLGAEKLAAATRHLVVGGEQLLRASVEFLLADGLNLSITNEYGPTETTVGSVAYTFRPGDLVSDPVPIGEPIWNTEVEIRGPGGEVLPVGAVGEITIFGAGVADGYRDLAEETAMKFVRDPLRIDGGGYRTGDMGRVWDGGEMEYHGRRDGQVKVHGYRVETLEVEAVLRRQPGVSEAALVAVPLEGGGVFLSGFVVGTGLSDDLAALDEAVRNELPWYACPDRVEWLERLPLNGVGKVDRAVLVERSRRPPARAHVPTGDSERAEVLATIWRRLLDRADVRPEDSFFALGGTSIQALHMVADARLAGLSLSVRDVVQERTLARIAAAASPLGEAAHEPNTAPRDLPLTPNQLAFLGCHSSDGGHWALRWVVPAPGPVSIERLERALRIVRGRHPALRCSFSPGPPWQASLAAAPAAAPPELFDVAGYPPAEAEARIEAHLRHLEHSLDPAKGETSRLAVFDAGKEPPCVAWVVHHLVCDVVSLQVLDRELWRAYGDELATGGDDGYVDWVLEVSPDPPRTLPRRISRGEARVWQQSFAVRFDVLSSAARERRSLEVLAAALARALGAESGEVAPRFCIELHGRDGHLPGSAPAGAVGWFTAFHRIDLDRDSLASAEATWAAVAVSLASPVADGLDSFEISLNFLGELGEAADSAAPHLVAADDPSQELLFGLELVCWTRGGALEAAWRYDTAQWDGGDVHRIARAFDRHVAAQLAIAARSPVRAEETSDPSLSECDLSRIRDSLR